MKNSLMILFVLAAFSLDAQSQQNPGAPKDTSGIAVVSVDLPTIQCGSCKMNIEKALKGLEGVKKASVDLKTKKAQVEFLTAKLDLGRIETAITLAGYGANDKKADPDAYEKLDECCKVH